MARLSIQSLTKRFGAVVAVDDLSLEIGEGELLTLLGPSGCGKSTTLRCIAGLERPDAGEIVLGEVPLTSVRRGDFVPPERRQVGMVFQSYAVWPHMTVFENVAYPLRAMGRPKAEVGLRVRGALELVRLAGLEGRLPSQLSGGQQQRVALARALIGTPRLLLFDEPLSNLDAKLREEMRLEIRELQSRLGITSVYVTHDQAEAMVISDRIVIMDRGRVVQMGRAREIYTRAKNQFVADFLGSANFFTASRWEPLGDGSLLAVTTEEGVVLRVQAPPDHLRAGRRLVSVRPEDVVVLGAPPPPGANAFPGRVIQAAFLGDRMEYVVAVAGARIRAKAPAASAHEVGAAVHILIPPERCTLLEGSG